MAIDWLTRKNPLTIETEKGDVELPMLVGALLRSTEVKTIGERQPMVSYGHDMAPPPEKCLR